MASNAIPGLLRVVIDSREKRPFTFEGLPVEIVPGTLTAGDYSLPGFEALAVVERKSLDDLVSCLSSDRARFERELVRLRGYDLACVVVEASWADMSEGRYKSRMLPHSAVQSVLALSTRYRVGFLFPGGRPEAEAATHSILRHFARDSRQRYRAAVRAMGVTAPAGGEG